MKETQTNLFQSTNSDISNVELVCKKLEYRLQSTCIWVYGKTSCLYCNYMGLDQNKMENILRQLTENSLLFPLYTPK